MVEVRFTRHLVRFFPGLGALSVRAGTVAQVVAQADEAFPGLARYLVTEAGGLRQHVNVFVDGELVADREKLSDTVTDGSEVFVMQALSGG